MGNVLKADSVNRSVIEGSRVFLVVERSFRRKNITSSLFVCTGKLYEERLLSLTLISLFLCLPG